MNNNYKCFLALFISIFFIENVFAQVDTTTSKPPSKFSLYMAKRKEVRLEKEKNGGFMITPLAGPAYTPEMGFTIAGGVMTSWRMDKLDTTLQRSSAPIMFGASAKGAVFFSSRISMFFKEDKFRLYSDIWYKNMPDNYYGIGYDSGNTTPEGENTTYYRRSWFQINPRFLWQFKKGWFIGPSLDINYTKGTDACEQVANDPNYKEYNEKPFNTGAGIVFQHDTRDVAVNAWSGMFLEFQSNFYGHFLGGDNVYQTYSVDVRKYFPVGKKPGRTIALQAKTRLSYGEVPYGEMSQLGTPFDLRGYRWGQYRDQSMVFGIAEYRHTFYKSDGTRSKFGMIGWAGVGSIGANPTDFNDWLPNAGVGFRVEVQPRMNLRLDCGIGKDGAKGFYFNFNESF